MCSSCTVVACLSLVLKAQTHVPVVLLSVDKSVRGDAWRHLRLIWIVERLEVKLVDISIVFEMDVESYKEK